jgi:uncharacterized protein (DUF2062 family)
MIMRRRHPRTRLQRIREAVWPSMGMARLTKYYRHRVARLPGTPYYIAAGFATGVAVSLTPFVGFHIAIGAAIAWLLGGSLVAMAIGTLVAGNPWTYPFIWLGTYKLGRWISGTHSAHDAPSALGQQFAFSDLLDKPTELLLPMSLGALPLAIAGWIVSFYIALNIIKRGKRIRTLRIHRGRKSSLKGNLR